MIPRISDLFEISRADVVYRAFCARFCYQATELIHSG